MKYTSDKIKSFIWLLVPILVLQASSTKAQGSFTQSQSIMSLLTGIEALDTNFNLEMNNGIFYKQINNHDIFVKISPNTTASTEIVVSNASLKKLIYKFSSPLIFKDANNLDCTGIMVTEISVINGIVDIKDFTDDSKRRCKRINEQIINDLKIFFKFSSTLPEFLETGGLGKGDASAWTDCDNRFNILGTNRPLVQRISYEKNMDSKCIFTLKANWKFFMSENEKFDNYILSSGKNTIDVTYLEFQIDSKTFTLNLNLDFNNVEELKIQSHSLDLTLPYPKIKSLSVYVDNKQKKTNPNITVSGNINSAIEQNSRIEIVSKKSSSTLIIDNGSSIEIPQFRIESSGKQTTINLGMGTSLNLKLKKSNIAFNDLTNLQISKGSIESSSLSALFSSEHSETSWAGLLNNVVFDIDGGLITLNSNSQLSIQSGRVLSSQLYLDSNYNPQIMGSFSTFAMNIAPGSVFSCKDSQFKFVLKDNSSISQDDRDPIQLIKGEEYPIGTLKCNFQFSKFSVNRLNQFNVNDGSFECDLKSIGKEQFSARTISIKGSILTKVKDQEINTDINLVGKLDFSKLNGPDFLGYLNFTITPLRNSFTFETECKNDNDLDYNAMCNEHIFPITLKINLSSPIALNNIKVEVENGQLKSFGSKTNGILQVSVPRGNGEYDPDNLDCSNIHTNIHNEDRGENDIRQLQEVVRANICLTRCLIHFWAKDTVYNVPFTINFEYLINNSNLNPTIVLYPKIDLSNINILYIRHGCDDPANATLISFFKDIDKEVHNLIEKKLLELGDKFSQSIILVP